MSTKMNWMRIALAFLFLTSFISAQFSAGHASDLPTTAGKVGMYESESERFLVRERGGQLEIVYNTESRPEDLFFRYVTNPLVKIDANRYQLLSFGPLRRETAAVNFEQDRFGRALAVNIGAKKYLRKFFDAEEGKTFQIKPLLPADELRARALSAVPPIEKGHFYAFDLVEIVGFDQTVKLDIRYAGTNNFMGIQLYEQPRAFLQRPAAESVVRVHKALQKFGYGLIVYDAYRPWYVTKMFWEATPDEQKIFVANPEKGSRHNRGGAVDVGLYYLDTGEAADMGSDYDEFSIRAFPSYPGGTGEQRARRDILRILMEMEGFTVYPEEWWHFDYIGWENYPVLNLRFDEI